MKELEKKLQAQMDKTIEALKYEFSTIRAGRANAQMLDKIREIVVEQLGVDAEQVVPEANFVEDLGADSLDTVELIMAFEEEFDVEIPDTDAEKIKTVQDVIDYIESK